MVILSQFEEARVVAPDAPMERGERRLSFTEYDDALAELLTFAGAASTLEELRRTLAMDPCVPVHQLSDAGLMREVAARLHHGELELRVRDPLSIDRE